MADRNGASVWVAGSYDAQLNLAFWGVAQTYDTGVLAHPKPGVNNDGLYTDCTLALNPDTGKLVWYYQHLPNDQWDFDWVFERQIVQMPVNGTVRPVIMTAGKMAIYDVLDAETGKWIYSKDLGLQNIVTSIDPATGKRTSIPNRFQVMATSASSVRTRAEPRAGFPVRITRIQESCMFRWWNHVWT